ncbi:MAG: amidohydrolase [Magnetococcales bacterium]|nr:amidohydrolase [Magnetococcales bacterium]
MNLFIKDARLLDDRRVDIHIEKGLITAMDGKLPPPPPGTEVLDARGMVATPGLINGHTHAAMTLFRGYGDDMFLMDWLQNRIWPAEAKMSEEDIYWGTKLACLEMIRSGTVQFHDMYWQYHAVARAVDDMGLRAGIGAILLDVAGVEQGDHLQELSEQLYDETSRYSQRIRYEHSPHAIYTVSEARLRWVAEFSEKRGTLVHIHLSETAREVSECQAQHGVRPAFYLDRVGLLNPRVYLAHGVHLDAAELDLIAERNATLVTNPVSNMKLAVGGTFPYQEVARRGINMAIGTDGAASNNSLDLFQDVKILALLQKHASHDPTTLPARVAWKILTGARAPVFGQSGRIAPGEKADLLLLNLEQVEITPHHDLISNLIYAATGHVVDTMVVDGRILMRGRRIDGEEEIRQEAAARARSLCVNN